MGARLPSLAQIAGDPTTAWETVQLHRYGQTATVQIHRLTCLWYRSHRDRPLTMLLVHDPSSKRALRAGAHLHRFGRIQRRARRALRLSLVDRGRLRGRQAARRRRRSAQPHRASRQAHRPVRAALHEPDNHLVRAPRPQPHRRGRTPRPRALVPHQDQPLDSRHARQAQTHDHRRAIFPRSTTQSLPPENQRHPTSLGRSSSKRRKSRSQKCCK